MNKRFYLDIFGILTIISVITITAFYGELWTYRYLVYALAVLCFVILIFFSFYDYAYIKEENEDSDEACEIVLLSEENTLVKSWELMGKVSLLVGKCNEEEDVDIDLSDTVFSGTVSDVHAILNYMDKSWYIEDNQSKNGTHIKGEDGKLYNIKDGQSKLKKNDYIYIGLNKLQIR